MLCQIPSDHSCCDTAVSRRFPSTRKYSAPLAANLCDEIQNTHPQRSTMVTEARKKQPLKAIEAGINSGILRDLHKTSHLTIRYPTPYYPFPLAMMPSPIQKQCAAYSGNSTPQTPPISCKTQTPPPSPQSSQI